MREGGQPGILSTVSCIPSSGSASSQTTPGFTSAATSLPPLEQLQHDILASTRMPGVERGIWGIVVQSLDRAERLFELNPRTLLVPASTAKLLSVAGCRRQRRLDLPVRNDAADHGSDRERTAPRRPRRRRYRRSVDWRSQR